MKYIIFDFKTSAVPIIFPEYVTHEDINRMVKSVYPGVTAESAGFVKMNGEEPFCYGNSVTIQKSSRPEDNNYIRSMFKH